MANITITPNMNLPAPVPSVDPGPDFAINNNACMYGIDGHDHTAGKGVPITPAAMNINADLSMANFNLTNSGAVLFTSKVAALTSLLQSLQVVGVDLYYVDGSGNSVRITQSGSVTGATGTITGLPSGTASASFAAGTFTFQSSTNTPATMNVGPLVTGAVTAGAKTVTIQASSSQAADYALTLPLAQGAGVPVNDGSGNLSFVPIGSTVTSTVGAVALTATVSKTITSVSLSAGTWLLSGGFTFFGSSTNAILDGGINTTPNSLVGTTSGLNLFFFPALFLTSAAFGSVTIPGFVVSPGSTTTYYLVGNSTQNGSTDGGSITAVRIA